MAPGIVMAGEVGSRIAGGAISQRGAANPGLLACSQELKVSAKVSLCSKVEGASNGPAHGYCEEEGVKRELWKSCARLGVKRKVHGGEGVQKLYFTGSSHEMSTSSQAIFSTTQCSSSCLATSMSCHRSLPPPPHHHRLITTATTTTEGPGTDLWFALRALRNSSCLPL